MPFALINPDNYYETGPKKGLLKEKFLSSPWHKDMVGTIHFSDQGNQFTIIWDEKKQNGRWFRLKK